MGGGGKLSSQLAKGVLGGIAGAGLMRMLGGGAHHYGGGLFGAPHMGGYFGGGPVFGGPDVGEVSTRKHMKTSTRTPMRTLGATSKVGYEE